MSDVTFARIASLAFDWIEPRRRASQVQLQVAPGSASPNEVLVPMPLVVDLNGDGRDEVVGVAGRRLGSAAQAPLSVVIVSRAAR
jgi:hypothetical protein